MMNIKRLILAGVSALLLGAGGSGIAQSTMADSAKGYGRVDTVQVSYRHYDRADGDSRHYRHYGGHHRSHGRHYYGDRSHWYSNQRHGYRPYYRRYWSDHDDYNRYGLILYFRD